MEPGSFSPEITRLRNHRIDPPDLLGLFQEVNREWFGGMLAAPLFRWNSRLRSSAGRFHPGTRGFTVRRKQLPLIEVATYLLEEEKAFELVRDTVAHEMIHYWLWLRGRPYGHTGEFLKKMREMGVSRYNPVPRVRPYRHVYACLACKKEFYSRKRLGPLACARCCKTHSEGRFDSRFRLIYVGEYDTLKATSVV
ncbi:MAG: SprT-like domain-containing protein [Bdellovibrionales bacterium]|nr:SprT-like domain-containing protein [Bdellovibrionales bacterium]